MEKVTTVDKETGWILRPSSPCTGRWFTNCLKIEPSGDVDLDDSETGGSAEESTGYKKRQKKRMRKKLTAKRKIMKKKNEMTRQTRTYPAAVVAMAFLFFVLFCTCCLNY